MMCKIKITFDYPPEWDDSSDPGNSIWILTGWGVMGAVMIVPAERVKETLEAVYGLGHSAEVEYLEEEYGNSKSSDPEDEAGKGNGRRGSSSDLN